MAMRWRWPPPNWAGYRSAASSGTPTRGSRSWNFNDDIALAVLVAPRSLGLRAPDDLAVIGVDDIPGAATAQPPLTTVVRDIDVIARGLARRIVDALDGKEATDVRIAEPLQVRVRRSA